MIPFVIVIIFSVGPDSTTTISRSMFLAVTRSKMVHILSMLIKLVVTATTTFSMLSRLELDQGHD